MYEDNIQYAIRRLKDTIIQHKGEAIYVEFIREDGDVIFTKPNGEQANTHLSQLDHTPIPLGYFKMEGGQWAWACRVPKRNDWRQGHHQNNITVFHNNPYRFDKVMKTNDFDFLLKGNYNSYYDCLKNDGAFSRNYCFEKGVLFYKADAIGKVIGGQLTMFDGHLHHKKRLERTYQ